MLSDLSANYRLEGDRAQTGRTGYRAQTDRTGKDRTDNKKPSRRRLRDLRDAGPAFARAEEAAHGPRCVLSTRQFRGGLVFEAHRLLYHSTLGLRVIKKRRRQIRGSLAL